MSVPPIGPAAAEPSIARADVAAQHSRAAATSMGVRMPALPQARRSPTAGPTFQDKSPITVPEPWQLSKETARRKTPFRRFAGAVWEARNTQARRVKWACSPLAGLHRFSRWSPAR
jgi:hypothetical protein